MRRFRGEFEERGIRIVAVSPAGGSPTAAVCEMYAVPFACLGDPTGGAYDAYGLDRSGLGRLVSLRALARAVAAFFRGHRQGRTVGDRARLPGAFIIDAGGRVRWAWRGRDASDHASGPELLAALDRLFRP